MNAFNGELEENGFEFCRIDNFEDFEGGKAFFLTHFHSDHMQGIYANKFHNIFKEQENIFFYCSEITNRFIEQDPRIDIPIKNIYMLEKEEPVFITHDDVCVKVTPLRAGHCPGSIMLLMESYTDRILYTGDFRLTLKDLEKSDCLHENGEIIKINNIYLDTTFADPLYASFPARKDSCNIIKEIIKRAQVLYNISYVAFKPPASVGVEYLMMELHKSFDKFIHVSDHSYYRFHSLIQPLEKIITTDISSTNLHFCTVNDKDCNPCPKTEKKYPQVLEIKPSAMYFDVDTTEDNKPYVQVSDLFYRVSYSSHCSLDELSDFVNYLKPEKVSPIVITKYNTKDLVIDMVSNWKNRKEDKAQ